MNEDITGYVGLDVHKESIALAVAAPGRAAPRFVGTTGPQLGELLKALSHLGRPEQLWLAYESGPCGYALARQLAARGYHCEVIAVAKTPRKPGERIKTDRRDALALARYLRAGELTPITIPDSRDEAMRHLSRTREDAVRARLRARQQLKAMLLRHGQRYTGKTSWTPAHERSRMSRKLVVRQQDQPKAVRDIAWRAQMRLCSRFRRLSARGIHQNKICVAIARELAAFIWDIARHTPAVR